MGDAPGTELVRPRRRAGLELALVVLVAITLLAPGISRYSLVDPWETHYGEVARMMLAGHDYVHTEWPGTNYEGQDNEGFRSKPILQFWMMAASLRAFGLASDGGYSGELAHEAARVQLALRLPFVLSAVAGLVLVWVMLARLVSRRVAWLALLVTGSCPMFCLIARQAMPDMPHAACVMGAFALFVLALEDGARPLVPLGRLRLGRRSLAWGARHVVFGLAGGFVAVQAACYASYFAHGRPLALRGPVPPAIWLPLAMLLGLAALSRRGFRWLRLPALLAGGVLAAIARAPAGESRLATWDRHAPDRYLVRALAWPVTRDWAATREVADRALRMAPVTTRRQVYLLGCYALLGVSVLAKGPPGLAVIGLVGVSHVVLGGRWRALYDGEFELKRGIVLMLVTFLPWHLAMFAVDGPLFIDQYVMFNILNRAGVGVDSSPGTFESYTAQLGVGMWLWAALVPAALLAAMLRARADRRAGRVRSLAGVWAIAAVFVFSIVQTKFHHYILPAVPALAILIAFLLDDLWAGRARLPLGLALVGAAIVLLVCRDLMHEPRRWVEMFVFRYDRPWPAAEPWQIDPSDGFLALGGAAAVALVLAATPWRRAAVIALAGSGLAIGLWALHVYMPIAGTHWGMGDAMRTYYRERTIYGEKLVYYGPGELYDAWHAAGDVRTFDTFVPDNLQVGQPMTVQIELRKADDERVTLGGATLVGTATAVGDHTVELTLAPHERDKVAALWQAGGARGRPPLAIVDADRLIAYQLYWRGENFWSQEEIWGRVPELRTSFPKTETSEFQKYLADRARAPLGRRYFVITDTARATAPRDLLPTQRGRDSYEVIDTTSNKFVLASFVL